MCFKKHGSNLKPGLAVTLINNTIKPNKAFKNTPKITVQFIHKKGLPDVGLSEGTHSKETGNF
jgi:hypothetical protein